MFDRLLDLTNDCVFNRLLYATNVFHINSSLHISIYCKEVIIITIIIIIIITHTHAHTLVHKLNKNELIMFFHPQDHAEEMLVLRFSPPSLQR